MDGESGAEAPRVLWQEEHLRWYDVLGALLFLSAGESVYSISSSSNGLLVRQPNFGAAVAATRFVS